MKVYTKKGDNGNTQLLGGKKVPKHHKRIESYGTVDELNSYVGLLRDLIENKETVNTLLDIQDRLFTMGALLAYDDGKNKMNLPLLDEVDVTILEEKIDQMIREKSRLAEDIIGSGEEWLGGFDMGQLKQLVSLDDG